MTFQIHTPETAPAGSREALGRIVTRYGFLPNLAGVFAESPAVLSGLLGAIGAFDAEAMTLTPMERQVVQLSTSLTNRCDYCAAAHGMLADRAGLPPDELVRLHRGEPLADTRLQALRHFVELLLATGGRVPAAELEAFLAAGFTRAQVLEAVFGMALKTLTNTANHLANTPVNPPFRPFLPDWAAARETR